MRCDSNRFADILPSIVRAESLLADLRPRRARGIVEVRRRLDASFDASLRGRYRPFARPARPDAFALRTLGLLGVEARDDGVESGQFCLLDRRDGVIDRGSSASFHDVCIILRTIDVDLMLSLLHS